MLILIFLLSLSINKSIALRNVIYCEDDSLKEYCECSIDKDLFFEIFICRKYLPLEFNTFPALNKQVIGFKLQNGFKKWPKAIKQENFSYLDLSFNQIQSIGDVSKLSNLVKLNLSHNLLEQFNPNYCDISLIYILDLSFNSIEFVSFKNFICITINSVSTNLYILMLQNNRIKQVDSLDLIFIGMENLYYLNMSSNLLTNLSISSISKVSADSFVEFYKYVYMEKYENEAKFLKNLSYISFTNNTLTSVKFSFELMYTYMTGLVEIDELVYLVLTSIMFYENRVKCSCDIYNDFKFIVDLYQSKFNMINLTLMDRRISKNRCFDEHNKSYNIVKLILSNNLTLFEHCNNGTRPKCSVCLMFIIFLFHFYLYFFNVFRLQ